MPYATVSVMQRWHAKFTKVPLKAVFNQIWIRYPHFCLLSFTCSLQKRIAHFLVKRSNGGGGGSLKITFIVP